MSLLLQFLLLVKPLLVWESLTRRDLERDVWAGGLTGQEPSADDDIWLLTNTAKNSTQYLEEGGLGNQSPEAAVPSRDDGPISPG